MGATGVRALIVYGDYPPKPKGMADGGADFVERLAESLSERGLSVSVLVSAREGRTEGFLANNGVRVLPVIADWTLRGAARREFASLRRLLVREPFDIVHLVYPDPYLRYGGDSYHLPFLLKIAGARHLVVTFFGFGYSQSSALSKLGLISLFWQADLIVITDRALLERFRRTFRFWAAKTRSGVVGGIRRRGDDVWSDAERLEVRASLSLPNAAELVGFFGFWTPDKGIEDLLSAVAQLVSEKRDLHLVLVGGRESELMTTYEASILRRIEELGLVKRVTVTGPLSAELVARYLRAIDVCALPFTTNPLGRSSLALALTIGVPTIVTRPAVAAEQLNGLMLVPPRVPAELARAIHRVASDSDMRVQLSNAALNVAARYSWDAIADEYVAHYQQIMRTK